MDRNESDILLKQSINDCMVFIKFKDQEDEKRNLKKEIKDILTMNIEAKCQGVL